MFLFKDAINEFIDNCDFYYCGNCSNSIFKNGPQILDHNAQLTAGLYSKYSVEIDRDNKNILFEAVYLDKFAITQSYHRNKTIFYKFETNSVFQAFSIHYNTYAYMTEMDIIDIDLKTITDKDIETYILYS